MALVAAANATRQLGMVADTFASDYFLCVPPCAQSLPDVGVFVVADPQHIMFCSKVCEMFVAAEH